ncbi:MAG: 1,4-beta-xylanase, partial [Flavisolibacter sp.]|nr:1,4-beta-xylanase [Flavisolibacter sp.]
MKRPLFLFFVLFVVFQLYAQRWSQQKANDWYRSQPWWVGANYIPATAINQLEMWQAETFDT